jgi:hypothetical protein
VTTTTKRNIIRTSDGTDGRVRQDVSDLASPVDITRDEADALRAANERGDHAEVERLTERARARDATPGVDLDAVPAAVDDVTRHELEMAALAYQRSGYSDESRPTPGQLHLMRMEMLRADGDDGSAEHPRAFRSPLFRAGGFLGALARERRITSAKLDTQQKRADAEDAAEAARLRTEIEHRRHELEELEARRNTARLITSYEMAMARGDVFEARRVIASDPRSAKPNAKPGRR